MITGWRSVAVVFKTRPEMPMMRAKENFGLE
jgi:hypothetical protein